MTKKRVSDPQCLETGHAVFDDQEILASHSGKLAFDIVIGHENSPYCDSTRLNLAPPVFCYCTALQQRDN